MLLRVEFRPLFGGCRSMVALARLAMLRFGVLLIPISLSACGVIRAQQNAAIIQSHNDRIAAINASCTAAMNAPDLDPIRAKVELMRPPITVEAPTPFAILINSSYPTEQEKAAIAHWGTIRDECNRQEAELWATEQIPANMPRQIFDKAASFSIGAHNQESLLIAGLYQSKLTFGEFAKERAEIYNQAREARLSFLQALQIQDQQERDREEEAAIQRYAIFSNALSNNMRALQSNQGVHCTSTPIGNSVSTNCQ